MRRLHGTRSPPSGQVSASRGASSDLPNETALSHVSRPVRAHDSGVGRRCSRVLAQEVMSNSGLAAQGLGVSHPGALDGFPVGTRFSANRGETRTLLSGRGMVPLRMDRNEAVGFPRSSPSHGHIGSIRGSMMLQNSVESRSPLNVPRGTSPFAAAQAVAFSSHGGGGGRHSLSASGQTSVGNIDTKSATWSSHIASGGQERSVTTQAPRATRGPGTNQGVLINSADTTSSGQGPAGVEQRQRTGRHASQSTVRPVHREEQPLPGSLRDLRRDRAEECLRGAVHAESRGPFVVDAHLLEGLQPRGSREQGTTDEVSAARTSASRTQGGGTLFDMLLGEGVATRVHRALSAEIGSIFSAMASRTSGSLAGSWGEAQIAFEGGPSSSADNHGMLRRVSVGPRATFVVCGTLGPRSRSARALARDFGSLVDELESALRFDTSDPLDTPFRRMGLGGDFDDGLAPFPAGADEPSIPLSQVLEASDLCSSLERHVIKWTYEGTASEDAAQGRACAGASAQTSPSSNKEALDKAHSAAAPTSCGESVARIATGHTPESQTQNGASAEMAKT
ncbi:hypothetical protein Efla_003156 [Eimeria flavescens]